MFHEKEIVYPVRERKNADFYNAEYYSGKNSNWDRPYTWGNFGGIFWEWFKFVLYTFPESKKFLDVGCGRGFFEKVFELGKSSTLVPITIHGFDHSEYAIATAEPEAVPFIECASLDTFAFRENYEVILAFDVFEHVSETQAKNFLKRSRRHIDDCICAVIALDEPRQRLEPSHCNLQDREYWHRVFLECGWVQPKEYKIMQELAQKYEHVRNCKCEVFIYGAGTKTVAEKISRALVYGFWRAKFFMIKTVTQSWQNVSQKFQHRLHSIKVSLLQFVPSTRKAQDVTTPSSSPS